MHTSGTCTNEIKIGMWGRVKRYIIICFNPKSECPYSIPTKIVSGEGWQNYHWQSRVTWIYLESRPSWVLCRCSATSALSALILNTCQSRLINSAANRSIGSTTGCTITKKAPTRAFSWLKVPTSAFTFKTLLRHYAKWALTPRQVDMKLVGAFSVIVQIHWFIDLRH